MSDGLTNLTTDEMVTWLIDCSIEWKDRYIDRLMDKRQSYPFTDRNRKGFNDKIHQSIVVKLEMRKMEVFSAAYLEIVGNW